VVEIEADEITKSPLHRAGAKQGQSGFALRFPRLVILRFDKAASDATTTQELLSLYKSFS
jgi:DNA ligase-1